MDTTEVLSKITYSQPGIMFIIPHYILDWQTELTKRAEEMDAKWQRLHSIEGCLLKALNQDWEAHEHDLLFSCLDRIRQRMTEIQWELEKGLWATNGYGDGYDE
jgi:hypothetical protein